MESDQFSENGGMGQGAGPQQGIILAELAPEQLTADMVGAPPPARRFWLPLALFVGTCVSTVHVGGWEYAAALMTILVCHEMGHFLQARRYGVHSSFPYFIPMPAPPFGTFGAVILMRSRIGSRRALFDIGISGPLAGLVPTLLFCVLGLYWSKPELALPPVLHSGPSLGAPLLFQWLSLWIHGPIPAQYELMLGPIAYAGWVGLFITALNLFPIGQLDGGHVLYALLRRKAHAVAIILLTAAAVMVVFFWKEFPTTHGWLLMIFLLTMFGPRHPPTADDDAPLGAGRIILGWLTLAFLLVGFTPTPF